MHLSPGGRSRTLRAGRHYHGPLPSIGAEPGSRSSASSTHWPYDTGWHECRPAGIEDTKLFRPRTTRRDAIAEHLAIEQGLNTVEEQGIFRGRAGIFQGVRELAAYSPTRSPGRSWSNLKSGPRPICWAFWLRWRSALAPTRFVACASNWTDALTCWRPQARRPATRTRAAHFSQ